MDVELSLDLLTCLISVADGISKHKMIYHCEMNLVFKAKLSNNSNYIISIISGITEVGWRARFMATCIRDSHHLEHITIQYGSVDWEQKDSTASFTNKKLKMRSLPRFIRLFVAD